MRNVLLSRKPCRTSETVALESIRPEVGVADPAVQRVLPSRARTLPRRPEPADPGHMLKNGQMGHVAIDARSTAPPWSPLSRQAGTAQTRGSGFTLKEAEAGRLRRTHRRDDAGSTRQRRLALKPPAFAKGSEIDARGGIPAACSIAGAKSQGDLLVAVGNPQWALGFRIPPSRH
jgi:hypothetical protein